MDTSYMDPLAQFICQARWDRLPADAQKAAKRVFLDVLGANMLGSEEPENAKLGEFMLRMSGPERTSTLLRSGFPRVDRFTAAYVNGTQAPAVELDDGFRHAISHAGAYVMSAALALAEALDSPVTEMLTAFAVGYEVSSRISLASKGPKFVINQHGMLNQFGTAAAACVLRHHDAETTREVLRIAASFAHVTVFSVLVEGATVRNLWVGAGSRDGLMAAELVPLGFLGHTDGVRVTLSREVPVFDETEIPKGLGEEYCITRNHHKWYACCTSFFAAVEATLELVTKNEVSHEQIERIIVDTYAPYHTMNEAHPRNTLAAKFSMAYSVAAAAVCRHADHEAFHMDRVKDPVILDMASRTELRPDESLAAGLPARRPARVTLMLRDGRQITGTVDNPRGNYLNPFTDEELEAKFARLAGRFLTEQGVAAVRDYIKNPESVSTARSITDAMRTHDRTAFSGG